MREKKKISNLRKRKSLTLNLIWRDEAEHEDLSFNFSLLQLALSFKRKLLRRNRALRFKFTSYFTGSMQGI